MAQLSLSHQRTWTHWEVTSVSREVVLALVILILILILIVVTGDWCRDRGERVARTHGATEVSMSLTNGK